MAVEAHIPTDPTIFQFNSEATMKTRHRCSLCSRTYERQDHLSRHLKSHDNERIHRCLECGKGFNRVDLLNRHRFSHAKDAGETFRHRIGRACEACIKAKTKCDHQRPCKRCKSKDVPCEETEPRRVSKAPPPSSPHHIPQASSVEHPRPRSVSRPIDDAALLLGLNSYIPDVNGTALTPSNDFQTLQDDFQASDMRLGDPQMSHFFDQVMMPGTVSGLLSNTTLPPDVSSFMQDTSFDLCDFDFSFLASGLTRPPTAQGMNNRDAIASPSNEEISQSDAHLRSEAFKRSPWSWNHWIPHNSHAFAGQDEINIQDGRVTASDQLTSPGALLSVRCDMGHADRDRMIRVVTQVAHQRLAVPSFPSLELLEDLVDVCLLQDGNAPDTFMHVATFKCSQVRTELLLAMVAAGARYIALPPVWKMGLVVQEVARLAIADVFETDNSTTRELQALQSSLLWLDIGAWSGFRRKTEIAISFLQPTVTMLSWAEALTTLRYADIVPRLEDLDDVLDDKWRAWAENESLKRLVIHTFLHDSQVAFANLKPPLISPAQLLLPLPASRELWLAPHAYSWRNTYLATKSLTAVKSPSLMEVFGEASLLEQLDDTFDKPLCLLAAAHAFGHEVWQIRQGMLQKHHRRNRWLAHLSRQRDLYDDLNAMLAYCELQHSVSQETIFTLEFLMMSLHVPLDDVQTFSGKSGEDEARKIFPRMREWTQDAQSRTAVWHAGQMFRVARLFEKTRLRDFYAVALYHSALTLWVYGMITGNTARKSNMQTPSPSVPRTGTIGLNPAPGLTHHVLVDSNNEKPAKAFMLLGHGVAGLQSPHSPFVPLYDSRSLMRTGEGLLKGNFPQSGNALPPLVENLSNLLHELGEFSG